MQHDEWPAFAGVGFLAAHRWTRGGVAVGARAHQRTAAVMAAGDLRAV